jgi:hypothetical protein
MRSGNWSVRRIAGVLMKGAAKKVILAALAANLLIAAIKPVEVLTLHENEAAAKAPRPK